jgi:hypothetical protein
LGAGSTATLLTARDSTAYSFSIDQNGDGITDWLLHPGGAVTGVAVDDEATSRPSVRFLRVAPNPFANSTRILVRVSGRSFRARLMIYDLAGRRVAERNLEMLASGEQLATWDGRNTAGEKVASGVYFMKALYPGGASAPKRVVILR